MNKQPIDLAATTAPNKVTVICTVGMLVMSMGLASGCSEKKPALAGLPSGDASHRCCCPADRRAADGRVGWNPRRLCERTDSAAGERLSDQAELPGRRRSPRDRFSLKSILAPSRRRSIRPRANSIRPRDRWSRHKRS